MPQGLEVFDARGLKICGITDKFCRILGTLTFGPNAGSVSIPGFANGRPWITVTNGYSSAFDTTLEICRVSIVGNSIVWSPPPLADGTIAAELTYGIY